MQGSTRQQLVEAAEQGVSAVELREHLHMGAQALAALNAETLIVPHATRAYAPGLETEPYTQHALLKQAFTPDHPMSLTCL